MMVFCVALFAALVAFNNITDYYSNFNYVMHVLSMDTTFPDNQGMWRRIESPLLHHIAYLLIIAVECLIAIFCAVGAYQLWKTRVDATAFAQAKKFANWGLTLGALLWFAGFIAIGGEWFLMWQSEVWNGQLESALFTIIILLVLIFLNQQEETL